VLDVTGADDNGGGADEVDPCAAPVENVLDPADPLLDVNEGAGAGDDTTPGAAPVENDPDATELLLDDAAGAGAGAGAGLAVCGVV
jgi:hypothetical protein